MYLEWDIPICKLDVHSRTKPYSFEILDMQSLL